MIELYLREIYMLPTLKFTFLSYSKLNLVVFKCFFLQPRHCFQLNLLVYSKQYTLYSRFIWRKNKPGCRENELLKTNIPLYCTTHIQCTVNVISDRSLTIFILNIILISKLERIKKVEDMLDGIFCKKNTINNLINVNFF